MAYDVIAHPVMKFVELLLYLNDGLEMLKSYF